MSIIPKWNTDCTGMIIDMSFDSNKNDGALVPIDTGIVILIILSLIYIPIMICIWINR